MNLRVRRNGFALLLPMLALAATLQGCAGGASMAILSSGAGSVASSSVERTFEGSSIKTYTGSRLEVEHAIRAALWRMGFEIASDKGDGGRRTITAKSSTRDVEVILEPVADNAYRVTVTVDGGSMLSRDPATASEILVQIATVLKNPQKADSRP